MFEKIYGILVSFLGESKQGGYSSDLLQYQFNCPACADDNDGIPDGKYNLEINLGIGKFNCWKCADVNGTKGRLSRLIRKYGGNLRYRQYKEAVEELKLSSLYTLNFDSPIELETFEAPVKLPETFKKITISDVRDRRLRSFLEKRKIDQTTIDKFNIGVTQWEDTDWKVRNRIIVPSYDEAGDLNYWVGRDFTGKNPYKYCNCEANKSQIVFQESLINWNADVFIVEGVLDCIRLPNTTAFMGKSLSDKDLLYQKIMDRAKAKVVLCLDADTEINETLKMCRLLDRRGVGDRLYYISMGENSLPKDFSEAYEKYGKRGITAIIKTMEKYTGNELWLRKL